MQHRQGFYEKYVKRLIDIVCSLVVLVLFWWLYIILAVLVRVKLGSPVLFKQQRPGKNERIFNMYKFRTMTDARDENGNLLPDEVRLTKFGNALRATSLDELPEIFNILKGDMTFIGPRPDTPMGTAAYTEEEKIILTVRPGVTGYNQAINRNSVLTREKLKNDIYYVKHLSLWFDIKIIFMTVATVLGHKNVNRVNVDTGDAYILNEDGSKSQNTTEIK